MRSSGALRGLTLGLLALTLALGAGCAEPPAARAVRAYDEALVVAYRTGDGDGLRAVATPEEMRRVRALLALKAAARLVLESELEALEVLAVERPSPDVAVVITRERWRYRDRPLDPGRTTPPETRSEMTMQYSVLRDRAGWRVRRVRTLGRGAPGDGTPAGAPAALPEPAPPAAQR